MRGEKRSRKKIMIQGLERETYRKVIWLMLAKEEGIGPERLLLFSLLICNSNSCYQILHMEWFTLLYKAYTGMYSILLPLTNNGDPSYGTENLEVDQ